ncbi:DnaJ domain-containing protein [Catenaria anguillulae PL171]|uniref:DnaJ domain-containing protein n=1 Tax=Catenaria anguillulae PL171 TaxID=765915 RepID=A0A1Y2HKV7_9FUNG|nr:DnaJ domain-containing protein [Catenaria anguillulae PL171]
MASQSTSPDPRFRPNLYAALGLLSPSTATAEDIKAAYRRIALEHHPDRHGGSESSVFIAAANAYQVLSDPLAKVAYDQWLRSTLDSSCFAGVVRKGLTR